MTPTDGTATGDSVRRRGAAAWRAIRANSPSTGVAVVVAGISIYTLVFGTMSIRQYHNYGNWAFDFAIYDQAFWLVSRFGDTFMSTRGLDVWGHHVTLIAYLFAPFYRLGFGPEFVLAAQSFALGLGALPVYLIARRRFDRPWVGVLFAYLYLMYAPLQNINHRDIHPEAFVIAPFLFAWYCAITRRWRWCIACLVLAMAAREDAALAVIMLGLVLAVTVWRDRERATRSRDLRWVGGVVALGAVWYAVTTQVVIPHFNNGNTAFYLEFFYSEWGGSFSGVIENTLRHPNRVVEAAIARDRLAFYAQLSSPLGFLPLLSPLHLLMALPQLFASVIGSSPYARMIRFQYTAVMVGPLLIAAIEGAHRLWRFRSPRRITVVVCFSLLAAYTTNVAWSSSPLGTDGNVAFVQANWRRDGLDRAVELVPDDAVVSSTFNLGPQLARREQSYNWPNPFVSEYWGTTTPLTIDCEFLPPPGEVDYIAFDRTVFAPNDRNSELLDAFTGPNGDFEIVDEALDREYQIAVARRVAPGPGGERLDVNCMPGPYPAAGTVGTHEYLLMHYFEPLGSPEVDLDLADRETLPGNLPGGQFERMRDAVEDADDGDVTDPDKVDDGPDDSGPDESGTDDQGSDEDDGPPPTVPGASPGSAFERRVPAH